MARVRAVDQHDLVEVSEAPLERTETGARPAGEGWFVLNVRNAQWFETDGAGFYASFESENARFPELGIGVGILRPGEPSAMYHGEDAQEDFLVLSGECLLLIEGEERRLKAWDFVHCPPWTEHIFRRRGRRALPRARRWRATEGAWHSLSRQRDRAEVWRRCRNGDVGPEGGIRAFRRRQAGRLSSRVC